MGSANFATGSNPSQGVASPSQTGTWQQTTELVDNVTGRKHLGGEITPKRLELAHELAPALGARFRHTGVEIPHHRHRRLLRPRRQRPRRRRAAEEGE
jgi:hypothetical protein